MTPQQRWDRAYGDVGDATIPEASAFVRHWSHLVPTGATGVDVAGGSGKHALWLASRGVRMTVLDISAVGLAQASRWAGRLNVEVATLVWDLETGAGASLPDGSWDVIVKTYFLNRKLLVELARRINPGGVLMFAQPTVTNLERHERPSQRFLLEVDEIRQLADAMVLAGEDLQIEHISQAWEANNTHEAQLVLRRAPESRR